MEHDIFVAKNTDVMFCFVFDRKAFCLQHKNVANKQTHKIYELQHQLCSIPFPPPPVATSSISWNISKKLQ